MSTPGAWFAGLHSWLCPIAGRGALRFQAVGSERFNERTFALIGSEQFSQRNFALSFTINTLANGKRVNRSIVVVSHAAPIGCE